MMATAFLGYVTSPKWYKFKNNFNKSTKNKSNNKQSFLRTRTSQLKYSHNLTTKRYYSNSIPIINEPSVVVISFLKEKNLKPLYIYEDLHLKSTKDKVSSETSNLSGIYLILNKITLDYYVGSAATNRFYSRFSNHLFNFNGSKVVKHAVKKYNISNFAFIVLELFPETVNKVNNKKLLDLEDFYLKILLPNYNILTEAGSSFGYKHTETTRLKMKANYSLERRNCIGNLNKGKNLSDETINKIREKALNRKSPIYSTQALANMKKTAKPILLYNLDNTIYAEYPSITQAAKSLDCSDKTIIRALKSKKGLLKKR